MPFTKDLPRAFKLRFSTMPCGILDLFMAMAKFEIEVAMNLHEAGVTAREDADGFATAKRMPGARIQGRVYRYPALGFLRSFRHVATSVYAEHLRDTEFRREAGNDLPSALR